MATQQWIWPLAGGRPGQGITTPFGAPQTVTGGYGNVFANKPHDAQGRPINTGVDLAARAGTPILNLADGVVEEVRVYSPQEEAAGRDSTGGYGNSVLVRLSTGERVRYSHMQQPPLLRRGQPVGAGVQLGTVGDTGNATGAHLDLEMQDAGGQYIDPLARGGFTPSQGLPPLSGGLSRPGATATGQPGTRYVSSLPPGARLGVPFRLAGQGVQNVLGFLSELPPGVQLGQPIGREQMTNFGFGSGGPSTSGRVEPWRITPPPGALSPGGAPIPGGPGGTPPPPGGPGGNPPRDEPPAEGQSAPQTQGASGPPGAGLGTPEQRYRDYNRDAVIAEIRRVAKEEGHPELAAVLIATAFQETGGNFWPGSVGDGGQSGGVFQENDGGRGAGIPMASRMNVTEATRRAVREFAQFAQRQPGLLEKDPGQLALNAQRPSKDVAAEYRANVNANTKVFAAQDEATGMVPPGAEGIPNPSVRGEDERSSAKLDQLRSQRQIANQRLGQANLDLERVTDWANRPENPTDITDQAEFDAYVNAVKAAKAKEPQVRAARDRAQAEVNRVDQLIGAEETRLDALTEKEQTWKLETVNGKPVWVNAKGETRPYTGPGSDPNKKVIGGTGSGERYIVVDNGDGTVTFQENKNYVGPKPDQVSGLGADTEYIGFVDPSGKVTYQKNPGFNPAKAYEHDGRVTLINSRTGQVISQTDTLPAEEREAATGKVLAETEKLKADAASAKLKADLDKKDAQEWQAIEDAIRSGDYTPQQINTMVLTAARNVSDFAKMQEVENARNTALETQRHNLAGEETETRRTRVSEAEGARQATESWGRYGLSTAPWQSMLLGAQAPITDVRKLGQQMNVSPDVVGPVAERYDRQMQQQEEFQNRRRQIQEQQAQPFFASLQAKNVPPTQPPPAGQEAPQGQKQVQEGMGAVDLKDQGKPGYARTYYTDGSYEDWPINAPAPQGTSAPQASAPQPPSAPPPAPASPAPAASSEGGADYGTAGNEPAGATSSPSSAPSTSEPAGEAGAGASSTFDASTGANYGAPSTWDDLVDRGGSPGPQPLPEMGSPPEGETFWDGVSPMTPWQLDRITQNMQYLSGGGGTPPPSPASSPGPEQPGVGGYYVGGGGSMPGMYISRFSPAGAGPGGGGGGGGGASQGGQPRRRRLPVPGRHILPLQEPGWARTEYDDGSAEEWHIEDGPSFEGVGGRGAGYHGELPPTYGIGWEEGTGGGGGSIWYLPPTPGASGAMGKPPMNPGGAFGGSAQPTTPAPPPGAGMAGGYAGPAPAGGGGDTAMGLTGGAGLGGFGAMTQNAMTPPPQPGSTPAGPIEPLTYGGGAQYAGGGGTGGQGGGMPGMFARAPQWDMATPSPFSTTGVGGPAGAAGQSTLYQPGATGRISQARPGPQLPNPAFGYGGGGGQQAPSAGGYYGSAGLPQAMSPLQRLLQQTGIVPPSAGRAAGAPGTV